MRLLFGKYWWLVPIAIILIIGLAVLIQMTKANNDVAEWFFKFFNEWAVILATTVTSILVLTAFLAVRENRRTQALARIRSWAEEVVLLLLGVSGAKQKNEGLQLLWIRSFAISADARFIGGDLKRKAGIALDKLNTFHKGISSEDESVKDAVIKEEFLEDLFNSISDLIEVSSGIAPTKRISKSSPKKSKRAREPRRRQIKQRR